MREVERASTCPMQTTSLHTEQQPPTINGLGFCKNGLISCNESVLQIPVTEPPNGIQRMSEGREGSRERGREGAGRKGGGGTNTSPLEKGQVCPYL